MTNLSFDNAMLQLQDGKLIARAAWTAPISYLTPADIAANDWQVVEVGADGLIHVPDPDINPPKDEK